MRGRSCTCSTAEVERDGYACDVSTSFQSWAGEKNNTRHTDFNGVGSLAGVNNGVKIPRHPTFFEGFPLPEGLEGETLLQSD